MLLGMFIRRHWQRLVCLPFPSLPLLSTALLIGLSLSSTDLQVGFIPNGIQFTMVRDCVTAAPTRTTPPHSRMVSRVMSSRPGACSWLPASQRVFLPAHHMPPSPRFGAPHVSRSPLLHTSPLLRVQGYSLPGDSLLWRYDHSKDTNWKGSFPFLKPDLSKHAPDNAEKFNMRTPSGEREKNFKTEAKCDDCGLSVSYTELDGGYDCGVPADAQRH